MHFFSKIGWVHGSWTRDKSVEINLGEFIYVQIFNVFLKLVIHRMWPVNVHCISSLLVSKCLDHIDVDNIICMKVYKLGLKCIQ